MISVKPMKKSLTELKLERLLKANKEHVAVGHFEESGVHYSGFTYPELMKLHHNGNDHFPPRPVLEILFQNHLQILSHPDVARAMKVYADSKMLEKDLTKMLRAVGKALAIEETEIFGTSQLTVNKKSTEQQKGGRNTPLIDTGELVDEVSYKDSITKVRKKV